MNKNKIVFSFLLSCLCLLGTSMSHATTDNRMLAERCIIVAKYIKELIPEQKEGFCIDTLRKSAKEMDISYGLIASGYSRSAIPFLDDATALLSDNRMSSCAKSLTIFKLSQDIKVIMIEAINNN